MAGTEKKELGINLRFSEREENRLEEVLEGLKRAYGPHVRPTLRTAILNSIDQLVISISEDPIKVNSQILNYRRDSMIAANAVRVTASEKERIDTTVNQFPALSLNHVIAFSLMNYQIPTTLSEIVEQEKKADSIITRRP